MRKLTTETTAITIQAAAQGDPKALTELFQNYEGMFQKAAHQPHLRCIAEEALGEARLSFLEAVRSYDPALGVPFPGYAKAKVYGDLRTLFKRERRRWQRELLPSTAAQDDGEAISFWDSLAAPGNLQEEILQHELLLQSLQKLPRRQQKLLHLLFFEERTQKEAAALLGISQQAAASMKARALKNLHASLAA